MPEHTIKNYFEEKPEKISNRNNMFQIFDEKEEFIVIGLTGRLGAGCSECAKILCSDYDQIQKNLPWPTPGLHGLRDDQERELRILARFANSHWQKFDSILGRDVISSFIIDDFDKFLNEINQLNKKNDIKDSIFEQLDREIRLIKTSNSIPLSNRFLNAIMSFEHLFIGNIQTRYDFTKRISELILDNDIKPTIENAISNMFHKLYYIYQDENRFLDRKILIEECNDVMEILVNNTILHYIDENKDWNKDNFTTVLKAFNMILQNKPKDICQTFLRFCYCKRILRSFSDAIHNVLQGPEFSRDTYTQIFQNYGNRIRFHGNISPAMEPVQNKNPNIFSIPRRINKCIKALRHPFNDDLHRPVRIVIDSIKNPFEALYLRNRYSAFTLVAVSTNEHLRRQRLLTKNYTQQEIAFLDWNEYPDLGYKKYEFIKKELSKKAPDSKHKHLNELAYFNGCDSIRRSSYDNRQYMFYLQDVGSCIESSDIYISNDVEEKHKHSLTTAIVRNIMLLVFPGLLQPTPIEKCMQIAYVAKLNSGCLSRQVGAVITDKEFNILSLGWNDVPCGDISCSNKNLVDLCEDHDRHAYTQYELESELFDGIKQKYVFRTNELKEVLHGLPLRYCFKNLENPETKEPMRARAMHAEEKALSLCGERAKDGILFTTSSPCEMCSKNIKNHKINRVYYIEPYPGNTEQQYTQSGQNDNRAQHILYAGAIGRAYTQMYSPLMPYKDMLKAIGVPDCFEVSMKTESSINKDKDEETAVGNVNQASSDRR